VLQAVSMEIQSDFLKTRLLSNVCLLPVLEQNSRKDLHRQTIQNFEVLYGLMFNNRVNEKRIEERFKFEEAVTDALRKGLIGKEPKNLRPDFKISVAEANIRKERGEKVPDWYIRTPEEERIVERMKEAWKNRQQQSEPNR
jgi:hypothetical protein